MTPDLSVEYLGLKLRSPFVASSSPRSERVENVERMAEAGAAAVVFHSLFAEQLPPAVTGDAFHVSPVDYCGHLTAARRLVSIPLIASLNVEGPGPWTEYASSLQDAGADAIELNIYRTPGVSLEGSEDIERRTIDAAVALVEAVKVPVCLKLSPFYTNFYGLASRLRQAGIGGLVLFNRFVQPDLAIHSGELPGVLPLSTGMEMRLAMHWCAALFGRLSLSLAASGGIHRATDAIRMIMAGADVTMLCSVLLRRGLTYFAELDHDLCEWMREFGYSAISDFRGSLSFGREEDPARIERLQYLHMLGHSEHRSDG